MSNKKSGFLYFCEKIKPDKEGFREKIWLDEPCAGWRILSRKPVNEPQGERMGISREGPLGSPLSKFYYPA